MTTVMERLTPIVEQIKASSALERERGLLSLKQLLQDASEDDQYAVEAHLVGRIPWLVHSEHWMHRLAALSMSKLLLAQRDAKNGEEQSKLQRDMLDACLTLLEDPEPRVRLAVSECMRLLAEQQGIAVWQASRDAILESIKACWDRDAVLQASSAAQQPLPGPSTPGLSLPRVSQGAASLSAGSEEAIPIPTADTAVGSPPRNGNTAVSRESAAPNEQPSTASNLGATTEHNRQQGSPGCPKPLPGAQREGAAQSEGTAPCSAPEHAQQTQRAANRHHSSSTQTNSGIEQAAGPGQGDFLTDLLSSSYTRHAPGTGDMRHDTEGWRCLETSFKVLQQIVEGCGDEFAPYVTPELRSVIFRSLLHRNRFVRETCYYTLAALCTLCSHAQLLDFASDVAERLQDGLNENWSQVRFAACVAARSFMLALEPADREPHYPQLLPHLCFNRYDVAEGVSAYSQATWRLVMGDEGRVWVARCLPQVLEHYVRCSRTNNHTVREAACTCIAELAAKIDPDAVRPHVPAMLRTLITCLRDDSWPVRDAALLASGKCAASFPEECRALLPELQRLWTAHLDDNIPSVREDAAAALGVALHVYKQELLEVLLPLIRSMLPRAREQQGSCADSTDSPAMQLPTGAPPVMPGVRVVLAGRQEPEQDGIFSDVGLTRSKDTGGIDYSCGCMDYGFRRPKEAWEASDGAVHLLNELSSAAPETVPEFLPELAQVAALEDFEACRSLQTTIWKQLPQIAQGLGKKVFKRHMDLFWDPLFRSLQCRNPLCEAAAAQCITSLGSFVGPRILEGHLSDDQRDVLAARGLKLQTWHGQAP